MRDAFQVAGPAPDPDRKERPASQEGPDRREVLRRPRLPAAARPLSTLYLLTLMSAVDGSLVVLASTGQLRSLASAVTIGLTVIAGAGSWLAAHEAFRSTPRRKAVAGLALLGALTLAATLASVYLGTRLGTALQLHVLPKATGVILCVLAAEVAGLRVPRMRGVPLPALLLGAALLLEGTAQWIR